jgi:hypothetical protein
MKLLVKTTLTLINLAVLALAGPPLICHPFTIGGESSLPWTPGTNSWNSPDPKYDTGRLAADTLKVLDSGVTILARMETLRRAAIYSSKNPASGMELGARLIGRALTAEVKGQNNSLALFDAGYFVESMKQMAPISKSNEFAALDGYEWVRRSVPGMQDKPAVEYALGLIQSTASWPNEHLRRAAAGAQEGSLLAQNLAKHFPNKSLAEIKRILAPKSASL